MYFPKYIANDISLYFSFINVHFFYNHEDNESGILNALKTNKHLNTMQNHLLVPIRLHILTIRLLMTSASFINYHPGFCGESGPIGRQNKTCGANGPHCGAKEPPTAEPS